MGRLLKNSGFNGKVFFVVVCLYSCDLLWHCCDFGRPSLICTLAGESAGLAGESDARH